MLATLEVLASRMAPPAAQHLGSFCPRSARMERFARAAETATWNSDAEGGIIGSVQQPRRHPAASHAAAALAALLCALGCTRVGHADGPSALTDFFLSAGGFVLGSEPPAWTARCEALGGTPVPLQTQLRCDLAATPTRPRIQVMLTPIHGETRLGDVWIMAALSTPAEAITAFDAARAALSARFGPPMNLNGPSRCRTESERESCLRDLGLGVVRIASEWRLSPPGPEGAPHPEAAALESVVLNATPAESRRSWAVSVTHRAHAR